MKVLPSITCILAKIPTRYQANMKQNALTMTTVTLNYFLSLLYTLKNKMIPRNCDKIGQVKMKIFQKFVLDIYKISHFTRSSCLIISFSI